MFRFGAGGTELEVQCAAFGGEEEGDGDDNDDEEDEEEDAVANEDEEDENSDNDEVKQENEEQEATAKHPAKSLKVHFHPLLSTCLPDLSARHETGSWENMLVCSPPAPHITMLGKWRRSDGSEVLLRRDNKMDDGGVKIGAVVDVLRWVVEGRCF